MDVDWLATTKQLLDLARQVPEDEHPEFHTHVKRAALIAYARHQSTNPEVLTAVADFERDLAAGQGFPDALPAHEVITRARASSEELRRAAG